MEQGQTDLVEGAAVHGPQLDGGGSHNGGGPGGLEQQGCVPKHPARLHVDLDLATFHLHRAAGLSKSRATGNSLKLCAIRHPVLASTNKMEYSQQHTPYNFSLYCSDSLCFCVNYVWCVCMLVLHNTIDIKC